jgi:chromosome segregation ATPase
MAKRSHISVVEGETNAFDVSENTDPLEEQVLDDHDDANVEWSEDEAEPAGRSWVIPSLATVGVAAWTIFYGWTIWPEVAADGTAQRWASSIIEWSVPTLLIIALLMLATRNSTREAQRYGLVARSLSDESELLESRLVIINRELSLAREFLGNQSRDLEYLGRSASERISEHADRLQGLIRNNGEQIDSIHGASTAALENMEKLRGNLPVIANSARDVSNQIGGAGRAAQEQLGALVGGFERLNQFGEASERQVGSLRKRVDEALAAFLEQANELETITAERFAALSEGSDAVRRDLQTYEIEALSALRARSIALRSELAEAHTAASDEEERAIASLRVRVHSLRDEASEIARGIRENQDNAMGVWGGQIEAMRNRLDQAVAEIKQIDENALEAANAKLRALFEEEEKVNRRIAEHNRLFEEETLRRTETLSAVQDEMAASLEERLGTLDAVITERREAQRLQIGALVEDGEALGDRISALGTTFNSIAAQGHEAREALGGGIDALAEQLRSTREALTGTDEDIVRLTDASVRLLELIQASAKQSAENLPKAMEASEARLAEIEQRAGGIHSLLDQARMTGEGLTEGMTGIEDRTRAAMEGFDVFQQNFEGTSKRQIESVERLRFNLVALASDSNEFADQVQNELRQAIVTLEEKAQSALAAIEDEQSGRINRIAETIGSRSADQIEKALAERTENALAELDEARERSDQATREMTLHLREQLGRLNELTVNLETRIISAREKATDTIDGDFARRVALITESLNSNSIDIAKVLSSEVTDTAWASYLRGDRGIFTRRAVRLLDNSEAREIAEIYDNDSDFREHVNRYIHDFEGMLRTMLSTRDGNAVSVTLLSSDMGKLYVALAQALERLRQ